MADLKAAETRKLEALLRMGGGYVLDFTNQTFDEFVKESVGRSPFDAKYEFRSGSKANRLRAFWADEPNPVVGKLLNDLFDYMESEEPSVDRTHLTACRAIASRLNATQTVADVDAIATIAREHDLELVAKTVLDSINRNELVAGLDRLHTFTTGYLRSLCMQHGLTVDRGKPLHSAFGEYARVLRDGGHIQSRMTAAILKALSGPLEAFNDVRNNHSLAHDNELLNHEEAMLIFNHTTTGLRFLRDLERRIERQGKAKSGSELSSDDDLLF